MRLKQVNKENIRLFGIYCFAKGRKSVTIREIWSKVIPETNERQAAISRYVIVRIIVNRQGGESDSAMISENHANWFFST